MQVPFRLHYSTRANFPILLGIFFKKRKEKARTFPLIWLAGFHHVLLYSLALKNIKRPFKNLKTLCQNFSLLLIDIPGEKKIQGC